MEYTKSVKSQFNIIRLRLSKIKNVLVLQRFVFMFLVNRK